jgi:hypothetical protein
VCMRACVPACVYVPMCMHGFCVVCSIFMFKNVCVSLYCTYSTYMCTLHYVCMYISMLYFCMMFAYILHIHNVSRVPFCISCMIHSKMMFCVLLVPILRG